MNLRVLILCAISLSGLIACAPAKPRLELTPCAVGERQARCGSLSVAENRQSPDREIGLRVVVVKADGERKPDPIFFLAGGPGQGAAAMAPLLIEMLGPVTRGRDLVLIDQRGTGGSNPLVCTGGFALLEPANRSRFEECREQLSLRADLTQYTTIRAVEDLEEARRALGYDRINIIAGSYGTRPALAYLRAHPGHVRTAILRASAPLHFNILLDSSLSGERELQRLVAGNEDLARDLERIRDQVRRGPVTIRHEDQEIVVTELLLHQMLYAMLLNAQTREMLPTLVHSAAANGLAVFGPVARMMNAMYETVGVGLYLSVLCSEDVPRISAEEAKTEDFGRLVPALIEACSAWPTASVPDSFFDSAPSIVPVLVVSGALDPSTTVTQAEAAARSLGNARHIVLPNESHVPMFPGCAAEAARAFVETASLESVEGCGEAASR